MLFNKLAEQSPFDSAQDDRFAQGDRLIRMTGLLRMTGSLGITFRYHRHAERSRSMIVEA